jgi:hypothetical protein
VTLTAPPGAAKVRAGEAGALHADAGARQTNAGVAPGHAKGSGRVFVSPTGGAESVSHAR